jgi:ethanolaminephosphotransferase
VYASWAIGLFLYQTFDAVDGSQARRTRQSGPLGELFDHGVDAINTTLEVLLFSAAMNLGQGWKTVLTLFACKPSSMYDSFSFHVTDYCSIFDLLRADLG